MMDADTITKLVDQLEFQRQRANTAEAQIYDAVRILKSELDRDDDPKDTLCILVVVAVNSIARLKIMAQRGEL